MRQRLISFGRTLLSLGFVQVPREQKLPAGLGQEFVEGGADFQVPVPAGVFEPLADGGLGDP